MPGGRIIIQRLPTHPDFEGAYQKQDRVKLTKVCLFSFSEQ